ncbi:MAG: Uncharacterised protein [Bacteroidetes bacterium MED-G17]|nr:MAG: Uncharacterised protein [Bacteroidetes bacterium MED-G17]|tara:strand:+ start:28333 stop:28995 length:663 start_codon:yes stop_codon:yes gene_type:complete
MLTLLNLFLGVYAIKLGFGGALVKAAYLLLLSAFLDFLDGFAARLMKVSSDFGKQLDSFADFTSFGLAAAFLLYNSYIYFHFSGPILLLPLLLVVAAVWRLAKFNISTKSYSFTGLPSTLNGIFVACLPIVFESNRLGIHFSNELIFWLLTSCILFLSLAMIAPLPLRSLKIESLNWQSTRLPIAVLMVIFVAVAFLGFLAFPLLIVLYVLLSLLQHIQS